MRWRECLTDPLATDPGCVFQKCQPIGFGDHHIYLIGAFGSVDELAHILSPSSLIGITLGDVEQSDLFVCIWGCNKTGVCEWVADDHV